MFIWLQFQGIQYHLLTFVGMNVVQGIQTSKTLIHREEKRNLSHFLKKGRKAILEMNVFLSAARKTIFQSPWSFSQLAWLIHIKPPQLPGQSIMKLVAKKQKSLFHLVCWGLSNHTGGWWILWVFLCTNLLWICTIRGKDKASITWLNIIEWAL